MLEIVVRVARAIACLARLRILSHLAHSQEVAPSLLAKELRMAKNVLSTHLQVLSSTGLIKRRRSGAWSYCIGTSPYDKKTLSGQMCAWLQGILRSPYRALETSMDDEKRELDSAQMEKALHAIIFEAATAFTNVRRIQILRYLAKEKVATISALTKELSMSEPAAGRHLDKLVRRGYVESKSSGRRLSYRLVSKFKTPIHTKMFKIVNAHWRR